MSVATVSPTYSSAKSPAEALLAPVGDGPDVRGMLMAHLVFRNEFAKLADAIAAPGSAQRAAAIEEHITFACDVLHHHHVIEDTEIWPHLLRHAPEAQAILDRLESEHGQMDPMISAIRDRSRTLEERGYILRRLSDLINSHLDFEEEHALPLIREHFTAKEFLAVEKIVMKSMRKEVSTLIGVVSRYLSAAEFAQMLGTAPLPLRVLWKLSWRKQWAVMQLAVYGV